MSAPMRNQCPHVEQVLLGVDAQSAAAAGGSIPAVQEQRFRHSGMFGAVFGCVLNHGSEDIKLTVEHSDDDGDIDAYAALDLRVGGQDVSEIVVKPGARVAFAIEAFNTPTGVKAWAKVVAQAQTPSPARSMDGIVTLAYYTGEMHQRAARVG